MKEAKLKSWEDFGNMIEDEAKEKNTKDLWKTVRSLRGKYGKQRRVIKEGNKFVSEKNAILEYGGTNLLIGF